MEQGHRRSFNLRSSRWFRNRNLVSVTLILLLAGLPFASASGELASDNGYLRSSAVVRKLNGTSAWDASTTCDELCCQRQGNSTGANSTDGSDDSTDGSDESSQLFALQIPAWMEYVFIAVLVLLSALFSGLTLGLMSLDKTGLEIVMEGDNEDNKEAAKKIYPVRSKGNLLLCTLLLGNVVVNALLSILLAGYLNGLMGLFVSSFLIVIFGEILPQALCSRYALKIGSSVIPLVKVIIVLLYPVAFPLSFMLDKLLGGEVATTYSSSEMLKLVQIHVQENKLDADTAGAMAGALKYKNTLVHEVMTPLKHTFMLSVDEKLNFETIAKIFKTGYSRIPVYEITRNNVIGLLFVKDLIFVDPEDEVPTRNFVKIFGRGVHIVWPTDRLGDVLRELKQGRSHMALVRDVNSDHPEQDPFYEIKGIITLEDIIEEILGDEIVDETDAFVDGSHSVKVIRSEAFDWSRLRLLDNNIVDERLTVDEVNAVTAHLITNYATAVSLLTENQLRRVVSETSVRSLPSAEREVGKDFPEDLLYERGKKSDICTLVLSGKVTVIAGEEGFRSDVSAWSVLGASALQKPIYTPDFTAFVNNGPCRCVQFTRTSFFKAIDASAVEKLDIKSIPLTRRTSGDTALEHLEVGSEHGVNLRRSDNSRAENRTSLHRSKLIAALRRNTSPESVRLSSLAIGEAGKSGSVENVTESPPVSSKALAKRETTNGSSKVPYASSPHTALSEGGVYLPRSEASMASLKVPSLVEHSTESTSMQFLSVSNESLSYLPFSEESNGCEAN